jgi:hypothetical protein
MERPLGYSWYLWLSGEFAVPVKHQLQGCRPTCAPADRFARCAHFAAAEPDAVRHPGFFHAVKEYRTRSRR